MIKNNWFEQLLKKVNNLVIKVYYIVFYQSFDKQISYECEILASRKACWCALTMCGQVAASSLSESIQKGNVSVAAKNTLSLVSTLSVFITTWAESMHGQASRRFYVYHTKLGSYLVCTTCIDSDCKWHIHKDRQWKIIVNVIIHFSQWNSHVEVP